MMNLDTTNSYLLDNSMYSNVVSSDQINAGVGAATALAGIIQNRPKNDAKQAAKAQKKEFKNVCGRRPLLKKKRAAWDKCIAEYTKNKTAASTPDATPLAAPSALAQPSADQYAKTPPVTTQDSDGKFLGMPMALAVSIGALIVVGGGFLIYKKFFTHSAPSLISIPVAS